MRVIIYYLLLLIFIALIAGFLMFGGSSMSMPQMLGVSAALVLYTVAVSLVGEGSKDEREIQHRNISNRAGLIAGTVVLSVGVIYQLLTHQLDYWLLAGLILINLTKIITLIFLDRNH